MKPVRQLKLPSLGQGRAENARTNAGGNVLEKADSHQILLLSGLA